MKKFYICVNEAGQTLYNMYAGYWNDGSTKRRDGSTRWTFSAKHTPEESKAMQKCTQILTEKGNKNFHFELVEMDEPEPEAQTIETAVEVSNEPDEVSVAIEDAEAVELAQAV